MSGFASYDAIIAALSAGQGDDFWFSKVGSTMQANGIWHRTWIANGIPAAGAEPSTTPGVTYSSDGSSIRFPTQAGTKRIGLMFGAYCSQATTLMLFDRLAAVGGLSSASTGSKTVNSGTLPRYAAAASVNVQCWLEVTTASTTTNAICHLDSYTEDGGTTGIIGGSQTWPAAATVKDCMVGPMPLASTSRGLRSVEAGIKIDTANTAGVFNLVLLRPLVTLGLVASIGTDRDLVLQYIAMPQIFDTASLGIAMLAATSTAQSIQGTLRTAYA